MLKAGTSRAWPWSRRPRPQAIPSRAESGPPQRRVGPGLAVLAIRAHGQAGTKVGPAENLVLCVPAIETPENIQAAEVATRELNAGYLTLMLEGKYTEAFLAHNGEKAPKYTADEL